MPPLAGPRTPGDPLSRYLAWVHPEAPQRQLWLGGGTRGSRAASSRWGGVQPVFVRASYPGPEEEAPGVHS